MKMTIGKEEGLRINVDPLIKRHGWKAFGKRFEKYLKERLNEIAKSTAVPPDMFKEKEK